jgi:23S rRNA G2445 N2-methylase RlmL
MKGFAITSRGIEDISASEIRELTGAKAKAESGCVLFDFKKFEDLCLLCYKCQSADRILYWIGEFEFHDFFEELKRFVEKAKFDGWMGKCRTFRVECIREGNHDFKSVDAEAKIAEILLKSGRGWKLSIKGCDIVFFAYIAHSKCYFGVDFAGFELNKRPYKIFLHPNSLRGTIAYALVRESGFEKDEALLDPFSRDGVIVIEAALHAANFPVDYYKKEKFAFLKLGLIDSEKLFEGIDKKIIKKPKAGLYSFDYMFKHVDYSRKNAKIAGVDKKIDFSRVELEWLDIKFKKETIDRIVTNLPSSKNANLDKIYNEFFYQAEFILKKDGAIALLTRMPELVRKYAGRHSFAIAKERKIWSGEQELYMLVFKKKTI